MTAPDRRRAPWWMTLIIIICMLPAFILPFMLKTPVSELQETARTLVWLYPAYVVTAGVCAWICYPQRKEITWILLILLLLSHAAMWMLA